MITESGEHELVIHAFIVKIWLEEGSEPRGATWRGHVTHVPSKNRRHFLELEKVTEFIAGYLTAHGEASPPDAREGRAGHG